MAMNRAPRQARSRQGPSEETEKRGSNVPVSLPEEEEEEATCVACTEVIEYFAVGDGCRHKEFCGSCAIRQRLLYGKKECAFCKVVSLFPQLSA
jgi:hypothetical protein